MKDLAQESLLSGGTTCCAWARKCSLNINNLCSLAISCGEPSSPDNGGFHGDTYTYEATVTYYCNEGYGISSETTDATCQADANWSIDPPTCSGMY